MNQNNLLITSEKMELLHIGENLISSIVKKDLPHPLGYGLGQLNEKDNFLIYLSQQVEISSQEQMLISELCSEKTFQNPPLILICSSLNYNIKSMVKNLSVDKDILINTIFDGHSIHIEKSKEFVTIQIDHQELSFSAFTNSFILIFNDDGIKYFKHNTTDNTISPIIEILNKKKFLPYWNYEYVLEHHINLQNILPTELYNSLKKLTLENNEDYEYLQIFGKPFAVKHSLICLSNKYYHFFELNDESSLLHLMANTSNAYTQVTKKPEMYNQYNGYTFGLLGYDESTNHIRYLLQKSAVTNTTILLKGESGTGKTFLAKEIHKCSLRHDKPFVHVNCAAIPYNLIESELFGYDEGAFTGAKRGGKTGYFEMAEGGTLFLDEITELPLSLQGKLLEVIQNKTYFRVGGEKKKNTNIRLIVASNRNLKELIIKGKFREDLYYRINVFPIEIPPLRDRIDSLFSIAASLIPKICNDLGVNQQIISIDALKKMSKYNWPGNIRELENVIEKACILSNGKIIMEKDIELGSNTINSNTNKSLKELREEFEKGIIEDALKQCGGSKMQAAEYLKIGKTNLFEKIKKYGIHTTAKEVNHNDN